MTSPLLQVHRGGVPSRADKPELETERDAQPLGPLPQQAPRGVFTMPCRWYVGAWTVVAIASSGVVIDEAHPKTVGEYNDVCAQFEETLRVCDPHPDVATIREAR